MKLRFTEPAEAAYAAAFDYLFERNVDRKNKRGFGSMARKCSPEPCLSRRRQRTFYTRQSPICSEVSEVCGAGYGERSGERSNQRNGYREREAAS
jgi:hypothetical protein